MALHSFVTKSRGDKNKRRQNLKKDISSHSEDTMYDHRASLWLQLNEAVPDLCLKCSWSGAGSETIWSCLGGWCWLLCFLLVGLTSAATGLCCTESTAGSGIGPKDPPTTETGRGPTTEPSEAGRSVAPLLSPPVSLSLLSLGLCPSGYLGWGTQTDYGCHGPATCSSHQSRGRKRFLIQSKEHVQLKPAATLQATHKIQTKEFYKYQLSQV